MASSLVQAIGDIRTNNYGTLAQLVVIGYDYLLTFPDEVEYIWSQSWTKVSWLFVLVRYFGLCAYVACALIGSSFAPGSIEVIYALTSDEKIKLMVCRRTFHSLCEILEDGPYLNSCGKLIIFSAWATMMFIVGADLVMILRVWAMFSRSKIILGILLTLYAAETIMFLIACIVFSIPNKIISITSQVLNFSFCTLQQEPIIWAEIVDYVQLGLNALMCLLVIIRFVMKSAHIYKATKQWDVGCYMDLLVREGVLYFLAILAFTLVNVLALRSSIPASPLPAEIITLIQYVPVFTLAPRLILSMRGLYARDLRGGRPRHLDTEFGFSTMSSREGAPATDIMFANSQYDERGDMELFGECIEIKDAGVWQVSKDHA